MAKSYAISQSQLVEIETARKKNRNKNIERRLYVLVMRAEGKSLEEISEKTGYHISTASKLIARYMRDGISAIAENHYKGNRRNMSFEEEAAILAPLDLSPILCILRWSVKDCRASRTAGRIYPVLRTAPVIKRWATVWRYPAWSLSCRASPPRFYEAQR